jgi:hypothetical protein
MIQDLRRRQGKGHVSNVSKGLSRSEERYCIPGSVILLRSSKAPSGVVPVLVLLGCETILKQNI